MRFFRKNFYEIVLVFLLLIGFLYRINGLAGNYSFWVDEASTARFARGIIETGIPKISLTGYQENSYFVTHYLTALSFVFFGQNEFAARFPEVIFGTFLILVIYYVGKKIFNNYVGLAASLLATFSYIQIAWSRQARGYVILELFFLLSLYCLYLFTKSKKLFHLIFFGMFSLLSIWTHTLGLMIIPIAFFYLLIKGDLNKIFLNKLFLFGFLIFIVFVLYLTNFRIALDWVFAEKLKEVLKGRNFLFYYHSLFWRQYGLISFLALLGLIDLWLSKKRTELLFFLLSLGIYLFLASFFLLVPFEKYVLPLFPLLFLISSYALFRIASLLSKRKVKPILIFFFLLAFILLNGNKFSLKPRLFYTLNYDMREIPEIDHQGIYKIVEDKIENKERKEIAIIEIDQDIPAWYLGEGNVDFVPRINVAKDIIKNKNTGATFIHDFEEFEEVYQNFEFGFIVLIEHNFRFYPQGLVDFAKKNLFLEKREEYTWFSPDWNKWPVELYSWGFEEY